MEDIINLGGFAMILILFCLLIIVGIGIFDPYTFEDRAEEKCNKIDMELFDYSPGGMFIEKKITCWNPKTKEIKIIK